MADVKWIKIVTDIFDDEKVLLIEALPEADSVIVIWFKLLCLAGKQNNSGVFVLNGRIPYTDKMLASIFRRKESTVQLALQTFEQFGMIEVVENVITIPNWGKHQNLDQLQAKKEYMRGYMQKYRSKQTLLADCKTNSKANGKANVSQAEGELEEDIEVDIEVDKSIEVTGEKSPCPYQEILALYSSICLSYPKVTKLSDTRKKAIKARISSGYSLDDFKSLFTLAEQSDFLKGKNDRNWQAAFDWLIKDANMAKVLDGNYVNKKTQPTKQPEHKPMGDDFKW